MASAQHEFTPNVEHTKGAHPVAAGQIQLELMLLEKELPNFPDNPHAPYTDRQCPW